MRVRVGVSRSKRGLSSHRVCRGQGFADLRGGGRHTGCH